MEIIFTTSHLPGLGMKQNDDVLHSYTVAKTTTDCSFDEIGYGAS